MDESYAQTVRLLLRAAPDVFANDIFAMKGGTAINLFVRDMPRLSVDIDVAYIHWRTPREEALHAISNEIDAISLRLRKAGLATRKLTSKDLGDTKLIVEIDQNVPKEHKDQVCLERALTQTAASFAEEYELLVTRCS